MQTGNCNPPLPSLSLVQASPAVTDTVAVPGWLRKDLCTRVGMEAARLAKFNRRGTITQREVCSAVRALRKGRAHGGQQRARAVSLDI